MLTKGKGLKNTKRGRPSKSSPAPLVKDIPIAPADKMVRNFPKVCPFCHIETYSAQCRCGRITVINK